LLDKRTDKRCLRKRGAFLARCQPLFVSLQHAP
jgi:hypothetical protein